MIFHEEYARANAPARVNHLGEELLGPTLIAFGTPEQQRRFLPRIVAVEELWCQGYSEPGAGSDLANVSTKARLDATSDGRAVGRSTARRCGPRSPTWPTGASWSPAPSPGRSGTPGSPTCWCRWTRRASRCGRSIQLTGTSEFNEVFFTGARTDASMVVGEPGTGLAGGDGDARLRARRLHDRPAGRLPARAATRCVEVARANGAYDDPVVRDRLARAQVDLEVIRLNALRTLSTSSGAGEQAPQQASIAKLLWAGWHRTLGELAMLVRGPESLTTGPDYDLDEWQRMFLFTRADTIYGGSDEIQRNVLAERVLGLPREPVGDAK